MITNTFDIEELYKTYQSYTLQENLYMMKSFSEFQELLQTNQCLVSKNDNISGFILYNTVQTEAFITLLYGTNKEELLNHFEQTLDSTIHSIWIHFKNPTRLPWYPKKDVTHPGTQGVLLDSSLHHFLKQHHYIDYTMIDTYYQDITSFCIPEKIKTYKEEAKHQDFDVSFYDETKHTHIEEFCDQVGSLDWKHVILNNIQKETPHPLLVATYKNKVVGFTGPLYKEPLGRGYFAGIGVLEEYSGNKLGSILFYQLCEELKNLGASYMTLFTGRNNPAKHIYIKAGFEIAKTFMIMKKER